MQIQAAAEDVIATGDDDGTGAALRTTSVEVSGTTSCSLPALTHNGRSPMSLTWSPSAAASASRDTSSSRQVAPNAVNVQRLAIARTGMRVNMRELRRVFAVCVSGMVIFLWCNARAPQSTE